MSDLFTWLNAQLLRMDWLSDLVALIIENGFGLDMETRLGGSIHFFIYDVIKIFILLSVLIFSISYVQSYFPPERTRQILGRHKGLGANTMAALLGTLTPFCSCSSIPLFIGFTSAGLPLGVTFSFLISSPLVDLASVILLASIFNWWVALAYVFLGLVLAVLGGTVIGRMNLTDQVESFVLQSPVQNGLDERELSRVERLSFSLTQVTEVVTRVWIYVLIGVGIGAAIHNWIPQNMISALLGENNWWSVLVATLAGIPMYADIFGTLPIAEALVQKNVGLGTALAFMMAVTALSLPSMIMLKRVVKMRLLTVFFCIVTSGIILIGYIFNYFAVFLT